MHLVGIGRAWGRRGCDKALALGFQLTPTLSLPSRPAPAPPPPHTHTPPTHLILPEGPLPAPGCVGRILMVDAAVEVAAPAIKVPQVVAVGGAVVQHHVHHHPQAQGMGRVHKGAHVLRRGKGGGGGGGKEGWQV